MTEAKLSCLLIKEEAKGYYVRTTWVKMFPASLGVPSSQAVAWVWSSREIMFKCFVADFVKKGLHIGDHRV